MIPVVFVHGFMGGSRQWQGQAKALANRFNVISVDLPGFGENAHVEALHSISDYAMWVLNLLSVRGINRFHLIGHSMGGMVVQEMVASAPERIAQLVLYGTGATGVLPGRFETIETSKRRAVADGPRVTARRIAATWFLRQEAAEAYEECAAIAEKSNLPAILAGLDAMNGWSGAERLAEFRVKALVVWGDRDRTYNWSQTQQLWHSISGASLAVIPDCAHAVHLEKPELFNKVLEDFLSPEV
ncbi:MAG: alpha/beta hydrolase [Albidovulum sp.]